MVLSKCWFSSVERRIGMQGCLGVVLLGLLLMVARVGVAEPLYHRRDHSDQEDNTQNRRVVVSSKREAVIYLEKFGYLNCTLLRQKRSLTISEGSSDVECSDEEIEDAIKKLQIAFQLQPSGELDDATLTTMNTGRCGNKDTEQNSRRTIPLKKLLKASSPHFNDKSNSSRGDSNSASADRDSKSLSDLSRSLPDDDNETSEVAQDDVSHLQREHSQTRVRREALNIMQETAQQVESPLGSWIMEGDHENPLHRPRSRFRRSSNQLVSSSSHEDDYSPRKMLLEDMRKKFFEKERARKSELQQKHRNIFKEIADFHTGMRKRRKRSTGETTVSDDLKEALASRFVFWRLPTFAFSTRIPPEEARLALMKAFRYWSEVIPPNFQEKNDGDFFDVDILFVFGKYKHILCAIPFDGPGGALAHSIPGDSAHFDDNEDYRSNEYSGINLLRVATHELGHVLGLNHSLDPKSIMYPIYNGSVEVKLTTGDRNNIQDIYGKCDGSFDVVFDWLRAKRCGEYDDCSDREEYIYNTYFFREDRYWMYENKEQRPREGSPNEVTPYWIGVPDRLDAFVQVVKVIDTGTVDIKTYFFKGANYYKYDDAMDQVEDGYPRLISEDFGPVNQTSEPIPDNLDAVMYKLATGNLYFFKDQWVWKYDSALIGSNGCCTGKYLFTDLFPMADGSSRTLNGYIDTVFFSYFTNLFYFFQGNHLFKINSDEKIEYVGYWYDMFNYICNVEPL